MAKLSEQVNYSIVRREPVVCGGENVERVGLRLKHGEEE